MIGLVTHEDLEQLSNRLLVLEGKFAELVNELKEERKGAVSDEQKV